MLTHVTVLSENQFDLEIRNAKPSDSIRLEKIEGLDPPDLTLFMGDYARDGGTYGGRRVPPRNVILTLDLNPNHAESETVDGLRRLLYKAFMDPYVGSDGLILVLHDDTLANRFVQGHVDKFEADPFSEDTGVRISMMCPNPFIQDLAETDLTPAGPTFPFQYEGTAETGFQITAEISSSHPRATLALNEETAMAIDYAFLPGDILYVDTQRGQRSIRVVRTKNITNRALTSNVATLTVTGHGYEVGDTVIVAGVTGDTFFNGTWEITAVTTNTFSYALVHANVASTASVGTVTHSADILYALHPDSTWLELHSVENSLTIYGLTGGDVIGNLSDIKFRGLHWGV